MTQPSDTFVGVVLAGGLSRRMGGGDKSLIPVAGKPMLQHVIDRLAPQVGTVIVNANGDPGRFARFERTIVPDSVTGFAGPLAGVLAGLTWARQNRPDAAYVVSAASDTPFFPIDLVTRLSAAVGDNPDTIVLAETGGKVHPVFGLWPVALADDLAHWFETSETRKVLAFVDRHASARVAFDDTPAPGGLDPFYNANEPDDLLRAERALAEETA